MNGWAVLVGGLLTTIIGALSSIAIAKLTNRTNATLPTVAPYDALANRVSTLEQKDAEKSKIIATLRDHLEVVIRDRDALVAYVKALSAWVASGAKPPAPPVPSHLHDLLDPLVFEVAHITERSHTFTQTERTIRTPEE